MRSIMGGIRRKFMKNQLMSTSFNDSSSLEPEQEQNVIEWTTLFRRNWHIYAEYVLGIKLKPFQKVMLWLMGNSQFFFAICSRGISKTFITGLGAIIEMLLKPYSEVVITASTISQANIIVEQKIRDELIKKLSPYLLYMYEKEWLVITKPDDGYKIECKLNGSTLRVLPCLDSSRGGRSSFIVFEETRQLKKAIVDSVFEKMAHPRQAKYTLVNSDYGKNPRWREECKRVYITSAGMKYEWFWNTFKKIFVRHYQDKDIVSNVFASDIYVAIDNGLKTYNDLKHDQMNDSDMIFRAEDLNEMIGENENSFFTLKSFKTNQVLKQCFRPPTLVQLYSDSIPKFKPKAATEIRIIGADFAFANTTSKTKNDNTIIICVSLHWKRNKFERHLDYIERFEASESLAAVDRVRELFYDYQADYYVPDNRAGGESLYNYCTIPKEHPTRGKYWNPHGFSISERTKYQVVPEAKLKDLLNRTVDTEPIRCVIPFIATPELITKCWSELRKQLEINNIKFLVDMSKREDDLIDSGEYYNLTAEELADDKLPYGETELLIQEAVNLQAEFKFDRIKLTEPTTGTKDRIVILSYVNYIASLIENDWQKDQERSVDLDVDEIPWVW